MKRTILINGLIAGLISSIWFLISSFLNHDYFNMSLGMLIGYLTMLVAFSLIFVSVKMQRDRIQGGSISFKQAFKTGFFISLLAATVYVALWQLTFYVLKPEIGDKLLEMYLSDFMKSNPTPEKLEIFKKEQTEWMQMYKNPLVNISFTYLEILPMGLLVSVICAFILRRKKEPVADGIS